LFGRKDIPMGNESPFGAVIGPEGVPDFLDDMALLSIIPDRLAVRSEIRKLRRNQIVSLSGHLCDVTSPAGVRIPGHQTLDNGVQKWTAIIDQVNSGGGAV
jgi:hypothetical protein